MVILIVGSPHDKTIRHTIDRARRRGVPYRYFDILRFLRKGSYSWDFRARSGQLRCGGERLDLPDPAISALYLRLVDIAERVPVEERDGVRVRMRVLVQALRGVETMVVNRPGRDMSNWAKGYHQQLLAQCGFAVPRTLVTNEEAAARAFLAEVPSVVFKGASGVKTIASEFMADRYPRLSLLQTSPVFFQERIVGADVRTHLIGDSHISERIESSGVNYQFDGGHKTFEPMTVPDNIAERCRVYQAMSGLTFIGFDFMVTPDGEYFALEANPLPGYDSYDRRLGFSISDALLGLLSSGAAASS
jgi:glutathione synthase/RimK-type ligase-like ATP-grasp enzyme